MTTNSPVTIVTIKNKNMTDFRLMNLEYDSKK